MPTSGGDRPPASDQLCQNKRLISRRSEIPTSLWIYRGLVERWEQTLFGGKCTEKLKWTEVHTILPTSMWGWGRGFSPCPFGYAMGWIPSVNLSLSTQFFDQWHFFETNLNLYVNTPRHRTGSYPRSPRLPRSDWCRWWPCLGRLPSCRCFRCWSLLVWPGIAAEWTERWWSQLHFGGDMGCDGVGMWWVWGRGTRTLAI